MVAVDAKQAFDKIKREHLYFIMIKMNISSYLIYIIIVYYNDSWAIIRTQKDALYPSKIPGETSKGVHYALHSSQFMGTNSVRDKMQQHMAF